MYTEDASPPQTSNMDVTVDPSLRDQLCYLRAEFNDYREYANEVIIKLSAKIDYLQKTMTDKVGF